LVSILGGYKREKSKNYSTDCTDYTGVFKDVVKPSNVKHQPGLINKGKYAPALRTDGGETEDNERRLAAELARDSLVALVPCKEMARGSGALGSCTEVARDSVVALWSAAWNSCVGAFRKSNRLDTTTAWTQQPPGHNNRLDTEVRDLFREKMGNAV